MNEHALHQSRSPSDTETPQSAETTASGDGKQGLHRGLGNRHLQLIAIGGAIGTGLFMGSGKTISLAGPSILLVYAIIGFFLFFLMRAMGELLLSNLEYKSFRDIAEHILGPWAGFFAGWTYWFCWIVIGVADLTAVTAYVQYWWPDVPKWLAATALIALLLSLNLIAVRLFGEIEFWFALIKIVAIVALIAVAAVMLFTGFTSPDGHVASLSNLVNDGGFFPTGAVGFLAGFQIAFFAFLGIELVGTAAAETKDPVRTLPKAINAIPLRVMLFYILALAAIMTVNSVAFDQPGGQPVRVDVRPGRLRRRGGRGELRGAHVGRVVGQRRHLLHLAHAVRPGLGPQGPPRLRTAFEEQGTRTGSDVLVLLPVARPGAAVHHRLDRRGLHPGHDGGLGAVHLRLEPDRRVVPGVPPPHSGTASKLPLQDAVGHPDGLGRDRLLRVHDRGAGHGARHPPGAARVTAVVPDPRRGLLAASSPGGCRGRRQLTDPDRSPNYRPLANIGTQWRADGS